MGPVAALPTTIFYGIVVGVLGNFWVISLGVLVCACLVGPFLGVLSFSFWSCPCGSSDVLGVLFCVLVLFVVL